ncbi:beta-3 adrenergic receptor-like [Littorina saxatilis]|uniref:beta-3 adrenergic receptor-like n=1 Tax=Littorina saxatilis TaxID=31220 RepID=UPI0038B4E3F8
MLGAALNLFLMLAILPNPRMRSVRQVLLVHLALVGLVTSLILTLPAGILQLVTSLTATIPADWDSPPQFYPPAASSEHSLVVQPHHAVLPSPPPASDTNQGWPTALGGGANVPEGAEPEIDGQMTAAHVGPLCTLIGTSGVLLTATSVWTVAALAWDKHRAIANPLHHPLVAHKSTMAAWFAVMWTLSAALATPPVFGGGDLRFVPALSRCGMHAGSERGRWHALMVVLVGIVAPLSVMLYCYTHIFRIARAQSSRIAATMLRMVTLIQAPIAPPPARNIGMVRLRGTRAMATIVQLVGSCVASYVPWAVLLCHQAATNVTPSGLPAATAAILLHAAPLTAATVYGLRNRNLRASFSRFVTRKVQLWCQRHRRRPSIKSLTRNSSSAGLNRKQAAHNGLSPSVSGMRRTFSLQHQQLGTRRNTGGAQNHEASGALMPRPHSYNVLAMSFGFRDRDRDFGHDRENSELHDVMEINSEFPAIDLELNSEYPGILERETVT